MALPSGTRLGPYEITAPLGAGGMGEVYRARDSRLNRDVAIKTLPPAFADDSNRLARFQREAQALAALSHPNIAAIYGLEESGGSRALVMELVEGQTLSERITAGPIPLDEALAIARQIGAALEAAHEKGIVHRDLKPANIKIAPDGKVKVLDFGLAKAFDPEPASGSNPDFTASPTLTLESTRAGVILGTAAYMSPEQARGKAVDKRADIWAFGVVFFEMLTGRSTFEGETVSDTLAGVLRADIDWKLLPPDTPPAVRRLLERCLERDPKRRLRDMGDAWIEMDSPMLVPPAVVSAPAKPSPLPWIAAAVAGLLAIGGIAWGLLRSPASAPRPVIRSSFASAKPSIAVAVSRDASRLVFMEITGSGFGLAMRMMDQLDSKPLPLTENAYLPTFSPEGQWLAFLAGTDFKLKKMPVTGGTPITLADTGSDSLGITWGDDNTLVFGGSKGLRRVSSAGGAIEQLTKVDSAKGEAAHRWPYALPGGRGVLFSITITGGSPQVAVFDYKKHTYKVLAQNASTPKYTATGHLIYYRSSTLFAAPFNLSRLEIAGPEAPAVEHVAAVTEDGGDYTISENGVLVYVPGDSGTRGANTVLEWADRSGTMQPVSEAKQWGTGRLSPDGSHVANTIRSTSGEDVWTLELQRKIPTRLTFEGTNYYPVWSPDGKWIAFGGDIGNKHAIYRVASDGSAKPELLLETESAPVPTSFSPDGKTLLYHLPGGDKKTHIWAVTLPGGKPVQLHDNGLAEQIGQFSPDGRWVAYESTETGTLEVYVQPYPAGPKTRISTQGGHYPRWARSGKELFYWTIGVEVQLMSVDVKVGPGFSAGEPHGLFKAAAGTTWDPAPDGKRFLVELPQVAATGGLRMEAVVNWFDELTKRVPGK